MYFGFELNNGILKEFTPCIFREFSKIDIYKMFINQYNCYVEKDFRISPMSVTQEDTLQSIFHKKIDDLKQKNAVSLCPLSDKIIYYYENENYKKLKTLSAKTPVNLAAKMITMIYAKEIQGLIFDAQDFFTNYVYDKVRRRNKNKNMLFYDGYIIIEFSPDEKVGVFPSFKRMDVKKPCLANEDIKKAFWILEKHDLSRFFIAYPKNEAFKKHMKVKHQKCNTQLSLVPYVISHKIIYNYRRKQKTTILKGE